MRRLTILMLAGAAMTPVRALGQDAIPDDVARQLAAMQAEITRLSAEIAVLRTERAAHEAAVPDTLAAAAPAAAPQSAETTAVGAPQMSGKDGFTFKPRGRMQLDTAAIDAPDGIAGNGLGAATEFRRVYLGMEGDLPGDFGYRIEADFANSTAELTDVYLTYQPSDALTFTLGQIKPFLGLEEMTSDLFTSMLERAAFTSAFGFERRVGLSGVYAAGDVLVQAGLFADNASDLSADSNSSYSLDGRVVFSPGVGDGRLHFGASAHYRDLNDGATSVRYRVRPFVHTTDVRLIDTGDISASGERNFGLELAYVSGPFHATAEGHMMTTRRPGLDDPTFWGGYVEVGALVTGGDTTAYKGGVYDRIKPIKPLSEGGIGAIQLNARYDHIDLNDGPVTGGTQDTLGLSAIWMPTAHVRFLLNYGHLWVSDAAVPAGTDRDYQVDSMGIRAQVDF